MALKIKKLRQEMKKSPKDANTPMPRNANDYQIRRIVGGLRGLTRMYLPRNKQVLFMAQMQGDKNKYLTKIRFDEYKGKVSDTARKNAIKAKTATGKEIFLDPPNMNSNPVTISCTCSDFRFSMEYQLFTQGKHLLDKFSKGAKAGNKARAFTKYTRLTDPKKRPKSPENPNPDGADFKNPGNILSYCKHLHSLMRFLADRDLISGTY